MSTQHTQGRLEQSANIIRGPGGAGAVADTPEIARRLAACWNACEGLDADKLERMPTPFAKILNISFMELWERYTTLKEQRDELLKALTRIRALPVHPDAIRMAHKHAEDAITKAGGKTK